MNIFSSGLAFVAALAGVFFVGQAVTARFSKSGRQTSRRVRELDGSNLIDPVDVELQSMWLRQSVKSIGSGLDRILGGGKSDLKLQLSQAGFEDPSVVAKFSVIRLALLISLSLLGLLIAMMRNNSLPMILAYTIGGAMLGFLLPTFILTSRIKKRQRRIRNGVPDALDMMVLCIEGGGSLPAAISWVAEELEAVHPELGREMLLIQNELQMGFSAGQAFGAFADRTGVTDVRDLSAAILQSEKYGASVAKMLRTFAETARQDRQVWAEEIAQKAAVKIIFPMLLCIFPAMFIVILGPAAMQMTKLFNK